ncbi:MAG: hypothetical protein IJ849_01285 [Selenomonadaceae bacterium]|nr:hypothetical protein [Selenomonadaceae bacterium]
MDKEKMGQSLDMEQLDNVSGGTYFDSWDVAKFLKKAGFEGTLNASGTVDFGGTAEALKELGFTATFNPGSKQSGGKENVYTDESGKKYNQAEMMDFLKQKFPGVK